MTEAEAREATERIVGAAAVERLDRLAMLVIAENDRQNLVARSTVGAIWSRHILDSIQLLRWASGSHARWIDIGTGGGFPGLAVAIATKGETILVEPRRQRAMFLETMVSAFSLTNARVVQSRVDRLPPHPARVLSARAVAPIANLFEGALHCSRPGTTWLLPRGAGWQDDLARATVRWKGTFHVEQSQTDPASRIVIATNVARR